MATFLYFILVFGSIIFFHEFGHFFVAKISGVLVHEFSLGMGPKIIKYKGKETTYSLGIFPIGGYVKMEGEDENSDHEDSFSSKPPLKRFAIIAAGPLMNFILALVIFFSIFMFLGTPTATVGELIPGMPAERSGMMTGDQIVSINGTTTPEWVDVLNSITETNGKIDIIVERDGMQIPLSVESVSDDGRTVIGIESKIRRNLFYSIRMSFDRVWFVSTNIFAFLADLFKGKPLQGEIVGPVGIISMVNEASKYSIISVLSLAAVISINLGIVNLLPFPALDGGRLVFILLEMIKGSPVNKEKEGFVHFVGFILLMGLMAYMVIKDLGRLNLF